MPRNWTLMTPKTLLAILLCSACSNAPVDIGEKNPALAKSDLAAYAASWVGYAEAYQFEDGKDRVRLVLDELGQGSLRFGERELLGAPTDPAGYYPPQSASSRSWDKVPILSVWSGLEYSVRNAHVQSERIRLDSATTEPFAAYCALQTPYPDVLRGGYNCLPYSLPKSVADPSKGTCLVPATTTEASYTAGDPTVEVNCEQLAMCQGYAPGCECDENGCSIDSSQSDLSFDAALDDSQENLVGTLVLGNQRITIRLERE